VVARFLEGVFFPTLPPYRSDTSINFFLVGGVKRALALPQGRRAGKDKKTGWWMWEEKMGKFKRDEVPLLKYLPLPLVKGKGIKGMGSLIKK
jgi:hypothetical protein